MVIAIGKFKFKIRKCKDSDYWFCYKLMKNNMFSLITKAWGDWDPSKFRSVFNKKNIKIIEYKRKRIAFFNLEVKETFSYLYDIQISKIFRGKGLGSYLMKLIEQETKRKKLKKIRLQVLKKNPAKKLYLRLGYKKIKNKGPAIIMEKRL